MRIVYTIAAECDPPPREDAIDDLRGLAGDLEDLVASALFDAGAQFVVEAAAPRFDP